MVNRPLEDKRPVGPLFEVNKDEALGKKVQFGVPGTVMPNRSKSDLNVLFVLKQHVATLPQEFKKSSTLPDKIKDKVDGNPRVRHQRSGTTSGKPFSNQTIVVSFGADELPVQEAQINKIANTIERHFTQMSVDVKTIIYDTE